MYSKEVPWKASALSEFEFTENELSTATLYTERERHFVEYIIC